MARETSGTRDEFVWPETGPGFRPEQHRWRAEFPFPGPNLNRLCVQPEVVDFMTRVLQSTDLRLYQAQCSAKLRRYDELRATDAHRPEPLVAPTVKRSALVARRVVPVPLRRRRGERTHASRRARGLGRPVTERPVDLATETTRRSTPPSDPRPDRVARLLVYRTDVFHRAVEMTAPGCVPLPAEYQLSSSPDKNGSTSTRCQSRAVAPLDGVRRIGEAPRSSICSASRNRGIRSGTKRCWTRLPSAIRSSISRRGAPVLNPAS